MAITKIYIPISAVPMERPRVYKGRAITPKRSAAFIRTCRNIIAAQYKGTPIDTPCRAVLNIFKKRSPSSRTYGDVDNLAKSILDAMTGIVYRDDCLITELTVKKYYSPSAGILITIDTV